MPTIKDVAKAAGVSIKTVSRVINDNSEVADETRHHVQQVIKELGYQPSVVARSLVRGKSNTIGVVIPLSARYIFSHLFFSEVLRGIAEVLADHSLDLLVHLGQDNTPYVELYLQRRVDGLIMMSIPVDDLNLEGLLESAAPCVFTCRILDEHNSTNWVDVDFLGGIAQSVEHLLDLGHERIGLLAGRSNLVSVHLRVEGYRQALDKRQISVLDGLVLYDEFSFAAGQRLVNKLMGQDEPPTGIICGDDMMALGAIQGLRDMGYTVPEDVSVIGFDDIVLAKFSTPTLTTVRQDAYNKGHVAAKTLVSLMSTSPCPEPTQIILPTELVIRDSTTRAGER
jgi:LacI family transcriptional regulator